MSEKTFKPLTFEDFNIPEGDLKIIVEGAQKFLPPVEDDEDSASGKHPMPSTLTSDLNPRPIKYALTYHS